MILKDRLESKCPFHEKKLNFSIGRTYNKTAKEKCKTHDRDFKSLCIKHLKLRCGQCTSCYEESEKKCEFVQLEPDVDQGLNEIIGKYFEAMKKLNVEDSSFDLYSNFLSVAKNELFELKSIRDQLNSALNLDDSKVLMSIKQKYEKILDKDSLERIKDTTDSFEEVMGMNPSRKREKKKKESNAGGQQSMNNQNIGMGDSSGMGGMGDMGGMGGMGGGMGDFNGMGGENNMGGFEGGVMEGMGGNQREFAPDSAIIEVYKSLNQSGKHNLRMFYKMKTHEKEMLVSRFFFNQELSDVVYITGIGVGVSPVGDFIIINSLEISGEGINYNESDIFLVKTQQENIVENHMLNKKLPIKKNESYFVSIIVEGQGVNSFIICPGGKVNVVNTEGDFLQEPCPILYFLSDPYH
jgi:hypothetical protein